MLVEDRYATLLFYNNKKNIECQEKNAKQCNIFRIQVFLPLFTLLNPLKYLGLIRKITN